MIRVRVRVRDATAGERCITQADSRKFHRALSGLRAVGGGGYYSMKAALAVLKTQSTEGASLWVTFVRVSETVDECSVDACLFQGGHFSFKKLEGSTQLAALQSRAPAWLDVGTRLSESP
ncbi:hypothetical protein JZ751_015492 [Albula glossodonta]|uniref:Uncharacterized protein n=1 Tax=Albula glossodonta TaxID=121402 RepID=A0A8T2N1D7_9TELE|nr:hypothetical protein JZ751_015492 [Albula glossodonta]